MPECPSTSWWTDILCPGQVQDTEKWGQVYPFPAGFHCNQQQMTTYYRSWNLHAKTHVVTGLGTGKRRLPDEMQFLVNHLPDTPLSWSLEWEWLLSCPNPRSHRAACPTLTCCVHAHVLARAKNECNHGQERRGGWVGPGNTWQGGRQPGIHPNALLWGNTICELKFQAWLYALLSHWVSFIGISSCKCRTLNPKNTTLNPF